jgi:AcrR family transcriptional regulator
MVTPQHHRVLDVAEMLFSQFGIARVTTDEIARASGISKKTLYALFPSKQDVLLQACLRLARRVRDQYCASSFTDPSTYQRNLAAFVTAAVEAYAMLSDRLLEDLRGYEPRLLQRVETWQHVYLPRVLADVVAKGQSLNVVRPDVQPDIAAVALARIVLSIVHPDQRRNAEYVPRVETALRILLHGVIKP